MIVSYAIVLEHLELSGADNLSSPWASRVVEREQTQRNPYYRTNSRGGQAASSSERASPSSTTRGSTVVASLLLRVVELLLSLPFRLLLLRQSLLRLRSLLLESALFFDGSLLRPPHRLRMRLVLRLQDTRLRLDLYEVVLALELLGLPLGDEIVRSRWLVLD